MSTITKIVNILSAKYGFGIKEATEHVKAEIQAYKNMTKEEKDAIKEAEKQAKAAAKEAEKQAQKQAKAAAKQAKKPKAPRAKAPAKVPKPIKEVQPVQQPENNEYIVTFKNKSKKMNEEDIYFIEENEEYKLEFIYQFQQTANMENIDDAAIVMYCDCAIVKGRAYHDFVKKHPDIEFDLIVFCFEQPSQMNYTFVFNGEEYEVKFHKV